MILLAIAAATISTAQHTRARYNPNTYEVRPEERLYETRLGTMIHIGNESLTTAAFSPDRSRAILQCSLPGKKGEKKHILVSGRGNDRLQLQLPSPCRIGWIGENSFFCLHGDAENPAGGKQFVSVYDTKTLKKRWTKELAARSELASSQGSEAYVFVSRPNEITGFRSLLRNPEYDVLPITANGLGESIMKVSSPAGTPDQNGFAAYCYRRVASKYSSSGFALEVDPQAKLFRKFALGYRASSFIPSPKGTNHPPEPKMLQSVTFACAVSDGGYPNNGTLYAFHVVDRRVRCLRIPNMRDPRFFVGEKFVVVASWQSIDLLPVERRRDRAWYPREIKRLGPVPQWSFPQG